LRSRPVVRPFFAAPPPASGSAQTWPGRRRPQGCWRAPIGCPSGTRWSGSAVSYGAPPRERRRVHAALAAVIDPVTDPDSHAWHLAAAAGGPDEGGGSEPVRSAARARANADHAAEAMLLTRAADLTPDRKRRADRLLDCAAAVLAAGEPTYGETLLDQADPSFLGPPARAR